MFSEKLNKTRKERGLTAQQMADKLGTGVRNYRKYESGDAKPTFDGIQEIAKILDVPVDYLMETGLYGTLARYSWIREALNPIVERYLNGYNSENGQSHSVSELDDAAFGEIASAIFAKVRVDSAAERNQITLFPKIPLPENPPEGTSGSD